jgi:hypothetical protein
VRRNIFTCFAKWSARLPLVLAAFALLAALAGPAPALEWKEPGEGEEKGHYEVKNAADLYFFVEQIVKKIPANQNVEYDVVLTGDIDLTEMNWVPINPPTEANGYSGTFDGKGHTIEFKSRDDGTDANTQILGLFGRICGGVVKDLVVSADLASSRSYRAGIVTALLDGGTIENVRVYGAIGNASWAGGIACVIRGTNPKILNCANYARITSFGYAGGIAGMSEASGRIENCANYGEIIGVSTGTSSSITDCTGGIIGCLYDTAANGITISNCYNAGAIRQPNRSSISNKVGGLLGGGYYEWFNGGPLRVEYCFNYGPVTIGDAATANGPVITGGGWDTTDPEDNILTPIFNNTFYLPGSGGALFGTMKPENPNIGGANGEDGWGSEAIKALVKGMTEEEFADGTMLTQLNAGPGGTIDGKPQWAQGRYYPELINFLVDWMPPTLTHGAADRVSDAEAAVTFSSDEAGTYYYAVTESGAGAPAIATDGEGWELVAGENTITLNNLVSKSAYDIHIRAKDAEGNVSGQTKITIPAYDPPVTIPEDDPPVTIPEDNVSVVTSEDKTVITANPGTNAVKVADGSKTVVIRTDILTEMADNIAALNTAQESKPIEINVAVPRTAADGEFNTSKISLPAEGLKNILEEIKTDHDVKIILLEDICEAAIDKAVLRTVVEKAAEAGGQDVTVDIIAERKDEDDNSLTPKQKDILTDDKFRGIYDISIWVNDEKLEDFKADGGKLTIGLPFGLGAGEFGEYVWTYRVDDDGSTVRMETGRFYDDDKNLAVFETDHLSVYSPAYEPAYEQGEPSPSDGGCSAGIGGAITLLLAAVIRAARRKD